MMAIEVRSVMESHKGMGLEGTIGRGGYRYFERDCTVASC